MALPTNSSLAKKHGCTPVSSNCVVWQGPDLDCIGLCHGDTISDVIAKIAELLCNIIDELDISNFNFACLLDASSPQPVNIQDLIQLIIDKHCACCEENSESEANEGSTEKSSTCPDSCFIDLPLWAQYLDPLGNTVKSMLIAEFAETTANKITTMLADITANAALGAQNATDIIDLDTRVTTVEGNYTQESQFNYILDNFIDTSGLAKFLPTAVKEFENNYVNQATAVGFNTILAQAIIAGTASNSKDALNSVGPLSSLPGWDSTATTLSGSVSNLWSAYADMYAAIEYIKENCCTTKCGQILYNLRSTVNVPSCALTIFLDGSTGLSEWHDCESGSPGSVYTVSDTSGNFTQGTIKILDTVGDPAGTSVDLSVTSIDCTETLTITIYPCVHNSIINSTCEQTISTIVYAADDCPAVTLTAGIYTIDYSFATISGYDYIVNLYEGVSSVVIESTTYNDPPGTIVGQFGSTIALTPNQAYRVEVVLQDSTGKQTVCPVTATTTLPEACLAPAVTLISFVTHP